MTTVYSANNSLFAVKDLVFGWSVGFTVEELCPIELGVDLDIEHLTLARNAFVGPLYPQELRDALDAAILRVAAAVQKASELAKRVEEQAKVFQDSEFYYAAAWAVAPVEQQLSQLKRDQCWALSRLAIYYLRSLPPSPRVTRVIAFLKDNYFELSKREIEYGDLFLCESDCSVTVKKPTDPELVELLDGLIPFTK